MATIIQKVLFKNTTNETLYKLYMNAKMHSLIAGGPVEISAKVGSSFKAFGGAIKGKNLQLIKNRLIVQSWRGSDWDKKDLDKGWHDYYWNPWKQHLAGKTITRPEM